MTPGHPHNPLLEQLVRARAELSASREALRESHGSDDPSAPALMQREALASEQCMKLGEQLWNELRIERGQV
ncbi:MAG TPA: hypothetical protein VHL79_02980 [Ramlibacter sp.]|jgi:hypothetical protein|nr:hypothetical protein [Ramlibacter sp.]